MNFSKRQVTFLGLLLFSLVGLAQTKTPQQTLPERPKLVIGIVIDQMRWDYLFRYESKYSENGFKRLLKEGYQCSNTHINYSPSYTACGHTCVYTGSVPAIHGIVGNDWYDWNEKKVVYCTADTNYQSVGTISEAGKMSPQRMMTTTITDELKLGTNFRSKCIGVALKDRGSILPVGHTADAAYFFDGKSGNWITSSYYMSQLPTWVNIYNEQGLASKYVEQNWNTLLPIAQYEESTGDNEFFEQTFSNEKEPVFVHKVDELQQISYDVIRATPFGNTFTLDFAKNVIVNERLGKGQFTDFLAVSLSSTDYIGHQFGPNSVEAEDCYLRLDQDLASFFTYLDQSVGKGNYLLFITADHGAAHVPDFLKRSKIPAGVFSIDTAKQQLNRAIGSELGEGNWILAYENMQFYLNHDLAAQKNVDLEEIKKICISQLRRMNGVSSVIDLKELDDVTLPANFKRAIGYGQYPNRCGDLYMLLKPGWFENMKKGTTHGTIYPYDTHIPLIWMGWNVTPKEDYSEIYMTDIAPTLAAMLRIQEPNGSVGKVITGLFK